MRLILRLGLVLVVLLVAGFGAFLYLPAIGSFSAKALDHSVTDRVGGQLLFIHPCRRTGRHAFRCEVADSRGSGGATYVVAAHGRCWKARRLGRASSEGKLKRRASGCVRWRDQLRLLDRSL
jgi:hypothetical protein